MSLKETCQTLSREIRKIVPYDRLSVNLLQKDQNSVTVYSDELNLPAPAVPQGEPVSIEGTATGWVIDQKEPLICRDVLKDRRFPITHKRYKNVGLRSYVILPLMASGKVLGALNLGSLKPGRYGKKDIKILSPVAEILSLAIENLNLYEEAQRREEAQKLLKELSQDITSLDINSLLKKLTAKVREVFKVDISDVRVMEKGVWTLMGVSGIEGDLLTAGGTGPRRRWSWIVENRRPLFIRDISKETEFESGDMTRQVGITAYLGVPIISRGGEVIGLLRALSYQAREFTQEEMDLLQYLANGVAIALENARLYEEAKRREEIQRLLKELSQDITALDLGSLLRKLTKKVREVFRVDECDVGILETEEWSSLGEEVMDLRVVRPGSRLGRTKWIIENRRPLVIPDVTKAGDGPLGESTRYTGIRSYLGVPILSRSGDIIGVLRALTYQSREFTEEEVDLMQQMANGAAIAIENAKLLKELKEKTQELQSANRRLNRLLEEQTALREIFTQINLLDLGPLLQQLTVRALALLGVDHLLVRLVEKDGRLRTVAFAGKGAERHLQERALELSRGRSGWVMENLRPLAIRDVSQDKVFGPGHLMREMGIKSFLGVPLISREQKPIGVLTAFSYQEREFAPEEVAVAQQFAAGAAIAIENATLYQETKRREEIQELLKELSQDISSLEAGSLLRKLTLKVCDFFQADASDVRILEGERWFIKASTGIDPAPYQARRDAETPRGDYGSGWIAKNRKPLVIRDILSPEGVAAGQTVKSLGFRGYLGVPLLSRDLEVVGILRALSYNPREFAQQEVDLLQQLASGAAIALDNSKLLEEVRQKSRALGEINRELTEAYQAKSDFLNTMAHELRTPLNVIIGNAQLLQDGFYGDIGKRAKGGLESIGKNAHNLLNLINEILDLARLEAKRVPLHIDNVLVEEMIGDLESFFAPLVKEKGISLKIEWDGSAPRLRSDKDKIREVLQNLLANAIKYTDRGEVGLRVSSLSEGASQERRVSFCVRDTGIGIKKKDLTSIFEPFSVVEGVDRKKYPGSGLGLSIVRRLVELLEGKIHVESEFGKGSAFIVVLPLVHSTAPN